MRSVTHENLGIVIAYVLPGFTAPWGISCFSQTVRAWLDTSAGNSSAVGAFLFVAWASLGIGVFANLLRSLLLDPLQRRTGISKREWSYTMLQGNIGAEQQWRQDGFLQSLTITRLRIEDVKDGYSRKLR